MSDPSLLEWLTAGGTVAAAIVAAASVVISGKQGREQRRLLVEAQNRDIIERRADFELGLLMELATSTRSVVELNEARRLRQNDDNPFSRTRALLLALPPDLLPVLRALVAPHEDVLAKESLEHLRGKDYLRDVQRAIDRELRDAIFERRDPRVSAPLAFRPDRRFRRGR